MNRYVYVTTPIYYPNDKPHLGHAYTTILADIIARWFYLQGYNTFLLTGTDEHGLKLQREAEKRGKDPKTFVDEMSSIFRSYWDMLGIGYNRFIRTTDKDHEELVKYVLNKLLDKGYIYRGRYSGWYCSGCEKFYSEKEYIIENNTPICPIHKRPLEFIEEDTYFLKISEFRDYVLKILKEGDVVYPKQYAIEVASKIELEGLQDISIARPKSRVYWGIELPFDPNYTSYVWIDALLNYLTGIGYLKNTKEFTDYWSGAIQLIGKDILWFHTAIWFSILGMLGIPPPRKLLVHAYLTVKGHKMGKSLGNVISIEDTIKRYGNPEVVRFIIARIANYDKDTEVSWEIYDSIYNNDLLNNYGNLVRRVAVLAKRYLDGNVEKDLDEQFARDLDELKNKAIENYNNLNISEAIKYTLDIAHNTNSYLNRREPWKEANPMKTIYTALEAIRITSLLLQPVMPNTIKTILNMLGVEIERNIKQFDFGYIEKYKVVEAPLPFRKIS